MWIVPIDIYLEIRTENISFNDLLKINPHHINRNNMFIIKIFSKTKLLRRVAVFYSFAKLS